MSRKDFQGKSTKTGSSWRIWLKDGLAFLGRWAGPPEAGWSLSILGRSGLSAQADPSIRSLSIASILTAQKPRSPNHPPIDLCQKHGAEEEQLPLNFLSRPASPKIGSLTQSYITKNNSNIIHFIIYSPQGITGLLYHSHCRIRSSLAISI